MLALGPDIMRAPLPRSLVRIQDRLVKLLGSSVEGRASIVTGMLARDASEATSYWLQLVVSVGIATLGLVVSSSAVVIGAMLVAPLMGPIVGLAMGLGTGSPFLVLRSAGRIAMSVIVAVGGAALITVMLPFHELNAEILARTSPTVLDLITASFCALAGVYASLRTGSQTSTTAAGTSISISLVPPLCASGYGVGTAAWSVAGGAALLFLTNLVAIVFVGTASFVAAGFNRVDVAALERDELEKGAEGAPIARALARSLARLFGSGFGPALRFLMPVVLLMAVYLPLRQALDEVAWQVRVRSAVRKSIESEPLRIIESRVRVEHHEVEVVLVVLGTAEDASKTRARLDAELRQASGVAPRIEILAVPDATAFAGLESTLLTPQRVTRVATPTLPSPDAQLSGAQTRIRAAVEALWPTASSGPALATDVGVLEQDQIRIRVVHLGPPLGPDGVESLSRAIQVGLGRQARLLSVAVPAKPLGRQDGDLELVARVTAGVQATVGIPAVSVCVVQPAVPTGGPKARGAEVDLARVLDGVLATHPRVVRTEGDAWSVRFEVGKCAPPPSPAPAAPDAGAPG